jgi:hypothetical protein
MHPLRISDPRPKGIRDSLLLFRAADLERFRIAHVAWMRDFRIKRSGSLQLSDVLKSGKLECLAFWDGSIAEANIELENSLNKCTAPYFRRNYQA